jgi:hypothetical protein
MQQYEFVMVLLSIIVGLGITELLTNVARQIKNRKTVKLYWPHMAVVLTVFIALLQQWWESWWLQSIEHWNFLTLLFLLGGPVGLYILSHLLFPEKMEHTDFEGFYFSNSRIILLFAAFTVILGTLFKPLSFGNSLFNYDNAAPLFLIVIFVGLATFKNKLFHQIALSGVLAAVLLDITLFNLQL